MPERTTNATKPATASSNTIANTSCTRSSKAISFSRGDCTSPYYTVGPSGSKDIAP